MNPSAEINAYWNKRGRGYQHEARLEGDYHRLQESLLVDVLKMGGIPVQTILEIGCGFGRITKTLAEAFPESRIAAVDLSDDQLANARRYCGNCGNIVFDRHDLYSDQGFPGDRFDVAVASEVFLHHPGRAVRTFISKISGVSPFIANIDWCEHWQPPVSSHVWIHNYRAIYRDAGLDCASFVLPQKIDGKQQKLFIAGKNLPEALLRLERIVAHYSPEASEPAWEVVTQTPRAAPPENWDAAVRTAVTELQSIIPAGARFIVADDGQWSVAEAFEDRTLLPFLERDGRWWGPPENDEVAMTELDRMRREGAAYFAYAWPSFWWMEHYARFSQSVRQAFPCVLENERLIVFKLTP